MELNQYQKLTSRTAVYPGKGTQRGIEYTLLGLLGEAGELANKYKKILRSELDPYSRREAMMDELGDVLWYAAQFANEYNATLEEVGQYNIDKLANRYAEGQLKNTTGLDRDDRVFEIGKGICVK